MSRRLTALALASSVVLAAAGCGGGDGADTGDARSAASKVEADIVDFEFTPEPIRVEAGGSVTWLNSDAAPHTATADDREKFDTGTLRTSQSKQIVFERPGTYPYFCVFHPFMMGTVEVVE